MMKTDMDLPASPDPLRNTAGCAPLRRAGSLRRTTSIDVTWPEGRAPGMRLLGRARDVVTPRSGEGLRTLAEDMFDARLTTDRTIQSIKADPPRAGLEALVGERAGGGLRQALARAAPEERAKGTPLYLLLDDIGGASLVSTWAWSHWDPEWMAFSRGRMSEAQLEELMRRRRTVCIGLQNLQMPTDRKLDAAEMGAPVPDLRNPDDPQGWHELPSEHVVSMRRARRIDIWRDAGAIRIDAAFQDSATTPAGGRRAVHEYQLAATADPTTLEVLSVQADPRVLPHLDCPAAVGNIHRLVGARLSDLRERVVAELKGTAGCTHLNDAFRALADAPVLLERLDEELG